MATGKGTVFAADLLKLVLNGTAITGIAQNNASPNANTFAALHTASPTGASVQTTSEAAYPSYARVAVTRTSGWSVSAGAVATPSAAITFPVSTGSPSETESFFSIGELTSTGGKIFWFGPISPTITMNAAGITPQLTTATSITEA